jgi:hypothetical protein
LVTGDLIVDPGNHFRGRSEHSLDGKGRLNIPTRFRDVLRDQYELSYYDRDSSIYPKEMLLEPVGPQGKPTPQVTEPGKFTKSVPIMQDPDR